MSGAASSTFLVRSRFRPTQKPKNRKLRVDHFTGKPSALILCPRKRYQARRCIVGFNRPNVSSPKVIEQRVQRNPWNVPCPNNLCGVDVCVIVYPLGVNVVILRITDNDEVLPRRIVQLGLELRAIFDPSRRFRYEVALPIPTKRPPNFQILRCLVP